MSYVKSQNWEEARAKIEVLAELVEQIPHTFRFRLENLF